ncbi:MAG: hypothetical protein QN178_10910 [Armatimonadota bacterium]|nr:hypothetical protein [Armatimonadota bacterium]
MPRRSIERLDLQQPLVDPDRVLRLQGYRDLARVPPLVKDAAARMASLAEMLVEPRGWLRRMRVRGVDPAGRLCLDEGIEFHSLAAARLLRDAREAALVILTIGPALEHRVREMLAADQSVEGLLLDTVGWAAINALLSQTRIHLATDARAHGLRVGARMAPGLDDWALEEQRALFNAFGDAGLTVILTDTYGMVPNKSASGLYGLTPGVLSARGAAGG